MGLRDIIGEDPGVIEAIERVEELQMPGLAGSIYSCIGIPLAAFKIGHLSGPNIGSSTLRTAEMTTRTTNDRKVQKVLVYIL